MKKYLSIGDVSKMVGISTKSLRYYDDLGIFSPEYVNPTTGYRYYATHQLGVLNFIMFCIGTGISLKRFNDYILPDQIIDAEKLFADGEEIVQNKIKALNNTVKTAKMQNKYLNENEILLSNKGIFNQHISKRFFLVQPYSYKDISLQHYLKEITNLYRYAQNNDYGIIFNQGTYLLFEKCNYTLYIFLEVQYGIYNDARILEIPEGNYECEILKENKENEVFLLPKKYLCDNNYVEGTFIIMSEFLTKKTKINLTYSKIEINKDIQNITNPC